MWFVRSVDSCPSGGGTSFFGGRQRTQPVAVRVKINIEWLAGNHGINLHMAETQGHRKHGSDPERHREPVIV